MDAFTKGLQSFGLLIARIGLGALLILQGLSHWQPSGEGVQRLAAVYAAANAPWPSIAAWATTGFEVIGGLLLLVGALTRFVGGGVVVLAAMNVSYLSWYKYPALLQAAGADTGGIPYQIVVGVLGLLFVVFGGGAAAIDRLFKRKKATEESEAEDEGYVASMVSSPA